MFLHGRREDISKSVVFLCVLTWSKRGNVEKCSVFICFLGEVEKYSLFECFWFLCVSAWSKGEVSKRVVFVESVVSFCVFSV